MKLSKLTASLFFAGVVVSAQDDSSNNDSAVASTVANEDDVEFYLEEEENSNIIAKKTEEDPVKKISNPVYEDFLDVENPQDQVLSSQSDELGGQPKRVNYTIDFSIFESAEGDGLQIPYIVEFNELTHINYTFVNNEYHNATLIALTGHILDAQTQEAVANLTEARINPTTVQPGQNISFSQQFKLDLDEGYYYISPIVHVVIDEMEHPMGVSVPSKVIDLQPGPISFFNFSFLSILLTCGILTLSTYNSYKKVNTRSGNNKPLLKKLAKTAKIDKEEWTPKEYKQ